MLLAQPPNMYIVALGFGVLFMTRLITLELSQARAKLPTRLEAGALGPFFAIELLFVIAFVSFLWSSAG
jgi:hypothetical protein